MKIRLVFEALCLVLFLVFYSTAFDGADKPIWANIMLVSAILAYIAIRIMGLYVLRNPIKAHQMTDSLMRFRVSLKRMAWATSLTAMIFGLSMLGFFVSTIELTPHKYLMLVGMLLTLLVLVYMGHRIWQQKIKDLDQAIHGFSEDFEQ